MLSTKVSLSVVTAQVMGCPWATVAGINVLTPGRARGWAGLDWAGPQDQDPSRLVNTSELAGGR